MVAINRARESEISHGDVLSLFNYDGMSGLFTWRTDRGNGIPAGSVAGFRHVSGYWILVIKRRQFKAHRVAWLYVTGQWPEEEIDHINGIQGDNRFSNLRPATSLQNKLNCGIRKDNTSGVKGVHKTESGTWQARVSVGGKRVNLGFFKTAHEAAKVAAQARDVAHGSFARHR